MTNKEIVKAWYVALDGKDFNAVKNLMDSKYQFRNPMVPVPMNAEEHLGMMQQLTSAFDATHTLNVVISEDDYVAISGVWSGKHVGDFNGIPASGKTIELNFLDFYNIVNGKVVNHQIEFNPMTMMAQVGAMPENA